MIFITLHLLHLHLVLDCLTLLYLQCLQCLFPILSFLARNFTYMITLHCHFIIMKLYQALMAIQHMEFIQLSMVITPSHITQYLSKFITVIMSHW